MTIQPRDTQIIEEARRLLPMVLEARGIQPHIVDWVATERDGQRFLFGVIDVEQAIRSHRSLQPYRDSGILHDLSTLLGGRPVYLSNHTGLRFAILLNDAPPLPRRAALPRSLPANVIPFGVGERGALMVHPSKVVNAIVAGATGSGKSTLLQMFVYAARQQGWTVWLADAEPHTFNPDGWDAAADRPVAVTAEAFRDLIQALHAEMDRRAGLYGLAAENSLLPSDLEQFNRRAGRLGLEELPYGLLVVDEANSFFDQHGMDSAITELARRGRKWGLNIIMAAHSWKARDIPSALSEQFYTRILLKVNNPRAGDTLLDSRALGRRALTLPWEGRGFISLNRTLAQRFQAYYVEADRLGEMMAAARAARRPEEALDELDKKALVIARASGGKFTLAVLAAGGLSAGEAQTAHSRFVARGWAAKDPQRANGTYLRADKVQAAV